jgi:hypothetical protein
VKGSTSTGYSQLRVQLAGARRLGVSTTEPERSEGAKVAVGLVDLRSAETNRILAWLGHMDALQQAIGTADLEHSA